MHMRAMMSILFVATAWAAGQALADEPTLHEVYQAAQSGNVAQAQRLMQEVLRAHPNSAKAHYVEAELLAKQGQLGAASAELATAERLEPGLPFAKAEAVRELRARVGTGLPPFGAVSAPAASSGLPWGAILVGVGIVGLIILGVRAMARRSASMASASGMQPYSPNAPAQAPASPSPSPMAGGLGSGILGGLATGAALGAGMVAGEALAHKLAGHDEGVRAREIDAQAPSDMGGNDFGVADNSTWDDGGFGGVDSGGDWT